MRHPMTTRRCPPRARSARPLTAEETIEALNAMSGDADQLKALQAQVNQLRYANQHLLLGGG